MSRCRRGLSKTLAVQTDRSSARIERLPGGVGFDLMGAETCEPGGCKRDAAHALDQQPKAKIFISYSRKDMAFADRLEAALKVRGFEPLIDRTEIYAFEDWWQRIQALIGRADTIVFVLRPMRSPPTSRCKEVAHGAALNKRFAPIVARRVDDAAVPEPLRRLNFIFFDDPARLRPAPTSWARRCHRHRLDQAAHRVWRRGAAVAAANEPGGLLLRSPVLEQAERWIAARPSGAPTPTEETQTFVTGAAAPLLGGEIF